MIEKVNLNQIQHIQGEMTANTTGTSKSSESTQSCTTKIDFDELVERAKQSPADSEQSVEQAKKLLESGELESIENIRKAAENIIKYGI